MSHWPIAGILSRILHPSRYNALSANWQSASTFLFPFPSPRTNGNDGCIITNAYIIVSPSNYHM